MRRDLQAVLCLSLQLAACFVWARAPGIQVEMTSLIHSTVPATEGEIREITAASGNRRSLLVWQTSGHYFVGPVSRLKAALIAEDGSTIKELLVACKDEIVREKPAVAYSAGRFLLVWQQISENQDWDIFSTIIEENGHVDHPCGSPIADGAPNQALPTVAAAADGFVVLWQEAGSGKHYRLRAAKVDIKGIPRALGDLTYSKSIEEPLTRYGTGWNAPSSPYPRSTSDHAYVMGGTAQIVLAGDNTHLLTWDDEYGWSPGASGGYTRRFALLRWTRHDRPVVTNVLRSPAYSLGSSPGVLLIQDDVVLFATGSTLNRNDNEVAAATLLSLPNLRFNHNPNSETPGAKTWQSEEIIPLFYTPVNVAPRLAAYWYKTSWTVVAVGSRAADTPLNRNLYVNSLDKNGNLAQSALEANILVNSSLPLGDVAIVKSGTTHWLVWSEENGAGLLTRLQIAPLGMD